MDRTRAIVRLQADIEDQFPVIIFSDIPSGEEQDTKEGGSEQSYALLAYVEMDEVLYAVLVTEENCKNAEDDFIVDCYECGGTEDDRVYYLVEDELVLDRLGEAFVDAWEARQRRIKEFQALEH